MFDIVSVGLAGEPVSSKKRVLARALERGRSRLRDLRALLRTGSGRRPLVHFRSRVRPGPAVRFIGVSGRAPLSIRRLADPYRSPSVERKNGGFGRQNYVFSRVLPV